MSVIEGETMRLKRLLAASIFLVVTAGASAGIQHKVPADDGYCPEGEYFCETTPQYMVCDSSGTYCEVHAARTQCWCAY
jgi:hypothetical protein